MVDTSMVLVNNPEDEIVLSLVEQRMITHETVRIMVQVNAQRDEKTDEATMRASIKTILSKFIDADWRFTSVQRNKGQSRFENVVVQAIARVPEAQNVQLHELAAAASAADIQLINPVAQYALPFDEVQAINLSLRLALFARARMECAEYNKIGENTYRLGEVVFADTPKAASASQNMRAGNAYAHGQFSNSNAIASGGGYGDDENEGADEGAPDLGVTERFWVAAQVTLRQS